MRPRHLSFCLGFLSCFLLISCAGLFTYKYYGMQLADYREGKLLGPNPKDDLPISVCQPTEQDKGPCVVMLREAFFSMKKDFEQTKNNLIKCEQGQ